MTEEALGLKWRWRIVLLLTYALISEPASANSTLYGIAAGMPMINIVFIVWFISGAVFKAVFRKDFVFLGIGAPIALVLYVLAILDKHGDWDFFYDRALVVWMIYIAILTLYFAFPRPTISRRSRILNLAFHASFLIILIVGEIVGKVLYYSRIGSLAAWSEMAENYSAQAVLFAIIALIVSLWFRGIMAWRARRAR
jgi:hypothetical protein